MENHKSISGEVGLLFERAGDYLETRIDLLKLQAADKSADIISSLVSRLVLLVVALIFVMMLNIGIALWIGNALGGLHYGFFILAGFYLVTGLIFYSMRNKWIKQPVGDKMITKFFEGYEN
jgi:hypothetical protein